MLSIKLSIGKSESNPEPPQNKQHNIKTNPLHRLHMTLGIVLSGGHIKAGPTLFCSTTLCNRSSHPLMITMCICIYIYKHIVSPRVVHHYMILYYAIRFAE